VGTAGELHPKVAKAYGFPGRASAAEAHLDALFAAAPLITPAPRFSTQPLAKEDVALIVDADIPAAAVEAALRDGAGELLESVRLFRRLHRRPDRGRQEVARVRAPLPRA
jgi:phenylalanyl-tRNA synthetase beta chain